METLKQRHNEKINIDENEKPTGQTSDSSDSDEELETNNKKTKFQKKKKQKEQDPNQNGDENEETDENENFDQNEDEIDDEDKDEDGDEDEEENENQKNTENEFDSTLSETETSWETKIEILNQEGEECDNQLNALNELLKKLQRRKIRETQTQLLSKKEKTEKTENTKGKEVREDKEDQKKIETLNQKIHNTKQKLKKVTQQKQEVIFNLTQAYRNLVASCEHESTKKSCESRRGECVFVQASLKDSWYIPTWSYLKGESGKCTSKGKFEAGFTSLEQSFETWGQLQKDLEYLQKTQKIRKLNRYELSRLLHLEIEFKENKKAALQYKDKLELLAQLATQIQKKTEQINACENKQQVQIQLYKSTRKSRTSKESCSPTQIQSLKLEIVELQTKIDGLSGSLWELLKNNWKTIFWVLSLLVSLFLATYYGPALATAMVDYTKGKVAQHPYLLASSSAAACAALQIIFKNWSWFTVALLSSVCALVMYFAATTWAKSGNKQYQAETKSQQSKKTQPPTSPPQAQNPKDSSTQNVQHLIQQLQNFSLDENTKLNIQKEAKMEIETQLNMSWSRRQKANQDQIQLANQISEQVQKVTALKKLVDERAASSTIYRVLTHGGAESVDYQYKYEVSKLNQLRNEQLEFMSNFQRQEITTFETLYQNSFTEMETNKILFEELQTVYSSQYQSLELSRLQQIYEQFKQFSILVFKNLILSSEYQLLINKMKDELSQ